MESMNLGMSEMIFIFIAALILVGPKKLPEIMRQVGKFMGEFKRASNEFKYQIESEMRNLEMEAERAKPAILPPSAPLQASLQPPLEGTIANGALLEAPAETPAEPASDSAADAAPTLTSDPESVKSADA